MDSPLHKLEIACWFRDRLRDARAAALRDAEGCDEIILVLERMGMCVTKTMKELGGYKGALCLQALRSPLASEIPKECPELMMSFPNLYEYVHRGRNKAFHEGAYGRNLATHAVILATILEHSLMQDAKKVGDLMVPNPVCAALWHPISFIRQSMLVNSFSYLPVCDGDKSSWRLVSDREVACYVRGANSKEEIKRRLANPLEMASAEANGLTLIKAVTCSPATAIEQAMKKLGETAILVEHKGDLVGILTAHDLL